MARNVKTIPEKNIDVEKIIDKILKSSKLKIDEFLFKTGISMDAYRKMVERGNLSKGAVENILAQFDVNEGFLKGEEDLTSSGKLTHVQNEQIITEKPLGETVVALLGMVRQDSEYLRDQNADLTEHLKELNKQLVELTTIALANSKKE